MDMAAINQANIREFRQNGGTLSGILANTPMLLLTTTGAKSGREHTTPMAYVADGNHYVVSASKLGPPTHPDWYINLVANPEVIVEVGNEWFPARAATAAGVDRDRLYQAIVSSLPGTGDHQSRTTRQIPVVILDRMA